VTGFVAAERNRVGEFWVARNRDAHAWVEAFDPERGWVIVEATPSLGVPALTQASDVRQFWDSLRDRIERLRVMFQREGPIGVGTRLLAFLGTLPGVLMIAIAAVSVSVVWWWRRKRGDRGIARSPVARDLNRLLARMDARMTRRRLRRLDHETIQQFANRVQAGGVGDPALSAAADWYRRYGSLRYRREIEAAAVEELKQAM
jgi:hypothetical protein